MLQGFSVLLLALFVDRSLQGIAGLVGSLVGLLLLLGLTGARVALTIGLLCAALRHCHCNEDEQQWNQHQKRREYAIQQTWTEHKDGTPLDTLGLYILFL